MAKTKTTKADIDFEQDLWIAANELRGAVAENQYKDYVLSLLFVKHLSERYEIRKEEIRSEFTNPQSEYFTNDSYYIGKFAMAEGSGAGQFFTPGSVVRLLVEMLEPLKGRIVDLACGSGGMFVQRLKFIQSHGGDKADISIYGQERYKGTLRLCKMNLLLRNLSFDLKLGDSLLDDKFPTLRRMMP